jgi:hypothetical protein
MHYFVAPVRRNLFRHRRISVRHHHFDFAAETTLIELECRFALTFENEIWTQLHFVLLVGLVNSSRSMNGGTLKARKWRIRLTARYERDTVNNISSSVRRYVAVDIDTPIPVPSAI